jgi:hypothetical protein
MPTFRKIGLTALKSLPPYMGGGFYKNQNMEDSQKVIKVSPFCGQVIQNLSTVEQMLIKGNQP